MGTGANPAISKTLTPRKAILWLCFKLPLQDTLLNAVCSKPWGEITGVQRSRWHHRLKITAACPLVVDGAWRILSCHCLSSVKIIRPLLTRSLVCHVTHTHLWLQGTPEYYEEKLSKLVPCWSKRVFNVYMWVLFFVRQATTPSHKWKQSTRWPAFANKFRNLRRRKSIMAKKLQRLLQ